eukprot:1730283-Amphidinium_carterae.1
MGLTSALDSGVTVFSEALKRPVGKSSLRGDGNAPTDLRPSTTGLIIRSLTEPRLGTAAGHKQSPVLIDVRTACSGHKHTRDAG